ncbi:MAG: protein-disulfide reductase DsbD domain-containing protein [Planctomycetota bacterium]
MCLTRSAHGLAPNHPIFRGPYQVDLQHEAVPTPEGYRRYLDGTGLPESLDVWHVDTADYTSDDSLQPGTVADGWGFLDSPDTEIVAHGINSKGPSAVALGRHGSLFLWGFACPPSRMTPSGRNAFLNTVCYMRDFDHAPRLVQRTARDRRWFLQRHVGDPEALARAREDSEFVRYENRAFAIDEDCKALGLSNRSLELLDRCVADLESGVEVDRAVRILQRYTGLQLADVKAWRRWLTHSRSHLFFSDVGGYRFFGGDTPAMTSPDGPVATADSPVVAAATATPARVQPGEVINIAVTLTHAAGWHTYLRVPEGSAHEATRLRLALPDGWSTVGRWQLPAGIAATDDPKVRIATDTVTFRLRVRVAADQTAGDVDLDLSLGVLACDHDRCLPPEDIAVPIKIEVLRMR